MVDAFYRELGGWAATQLEACTRCGICAAACPFYEATGDPHLAPVWKLDLLRRAYEQRWTLGGWMRLALGIEKHIVDEQPGHWEEINFGGCSTCNRCSMACPMGIAVGRLLHELRDRLAEAGRLPTNLERVRETIGATRSVYDFPPEERAGWVEYMNDPPDDLYQRGSAGVVYFVGCVSSFTPRAQRIAEAFVRLLDHAGVIFTILGEGEACCGFPLRAAGMRAAADRVVAANLEAVRRAGAHTLVFTCPACRLMWRDEYAPHLSGVRLLHASELLVELLASGRLRLVKPLDLAVTYHDPCDLGRNGGVYTAPRRVLRAIPGLRLIEASERRESGLCCGGGGDVEMVAPQAVRQVARQSAERLAAGGAGALATACPQCLRVFEEAYKTVRPEMKVLDITELLVRAAGL